MNATPSTNSWLQAALSLTIDNRLEVLYTELELMRVETFSLIVLAIGLLSIPAFLLLALLAAMIHYAQINLPLEQLAQAAHDFKERKFNPSELDGLARRQDEIGAMTREFLQMAAKVEERTELLPQEAEEIRAKIR